MEEKFPVRLYVTAEKAEGSEAFRFTVHENKIDAIDGDGPTEMATYEICSVGKFKKQVEPLWEQNLGQSA